MIKNAYFLTISDNESRINNCEDQKYRLLDSGFETVEIFKNHKFPRAITKSLQKTYFPHLGEGIYSCTFGHVSIMREALSKGYEHVFICEDDIFLTDEALNFIKNLDVNYPNLQYDSIRLYYGLQGIDEDQLRNIYKYDMVGDLFRVRQIPPNTYMWGNLAYIVNRRYMKAYIEYFDEHVAVADRPNTDYENFVDKYGMRIYFHNNKRLILGKCYETSLRY